MFPLAPMGLKNERSLIVLFSLQYEKIAQVQLP